MVLNKSYDQPSQPCQTNDVIWSDGGSAQSPFFEHLHRYVVFALAVKCKHNRILLSCMHDRDRSEQNSIWLPYALVKDVCRDQSLQFESTQVGAYILSEYNQLPDKANLDSSDLPFGHTKWIRYTDVYIAETELHYRVVIGHAQWKVDWECCSHPGLAHLYWQPISVMINRQLGNDTEKALFDRVNGWEVKIAATAIQSGEAPSPNFWEVPSKISQYNVYRYLTDSPESLPNDAMQTCGRIVQHANLSLVQAAKLYTEFVLHTYPSTRLSVHSFGQFCRKIGLAQFYDARLYFPRLFCSFCFKAYGSLTFPELLVGLCSISKSTKLTSHNYGLTMLWKFCHVSRTVIANKPVLNAGDIQSLKKLFPEGSPTWTHLSAMTTTLDYEQFSQAITLGQIQMESVVQCQFAITDVGK